MDRSTSFLPSGFPSPFITLVPPPIITTPFYVFLPFRSPENLNQIFPPLLSLELAASNSEGPTSPARPTPPLFPHTTKRTRRTPNYRPLGNWSLLLRPPFAYENISPLYSRFFFFSPAPKSHDAFPIFPPGSVSRNITSCTVTSPKIKTQRPSLGPPPNLSQEVS